MFVLCSVFKKNLELSPHSWWQSYRWGKTHMESGFHLPLEVKQPWNVKYSSLLEKTIILKLGFASSLLPGDYLLPSKWLIGLSWYLICMIHLGTWNHPPKLVNTMNNGKFGTSSAQKCRLVGDVFPSSKTSPLFLGFQGRAFWLVFGECSSREGLPKLLIFSLFQSNFLLELFSLEWKWQEIIVPSPCLLDKIHGPFLPFCCTLLTWNLNTIPACYVSPPLWSFNEANFTEFFWCFWTTPPPSRDGKNGWNDFWEREKEGWIILGVQ